MGIFTKMTPISRRSFLKYGVGGVFALSSLPMISPQIAWEPGQRLARIAVGKVEVKSAPSFDSKTTKILYEDATEPWLKEVIGSPNFARGKNRRWVQVPDGFLYEPDLQSTYYKPNQPLTVLPSGEYGKGMWAEVTIPVADVVLANPPARAPVFKEPNFILRLYYGQVFWVDDLRISNGKPQYRVLEKHGSPGDVFWVDASAFRPITSDELRAINPEVDDKKIVINVSNQTLACFEGKNEVYFARVSTGAKFDAAGNAVDKWSTPVGLYHAVTRKYISLHMAGGSAASGYELFAVSWTSIFATGGVAIHATYWHSNYGEPMSHGCVNALPEDSKWVYLWTLPVVPYHEGKLEQSGYSGTKVEVIEARY